MTQPSSADRRRSRTLYHMGQIRNPEAFANLITTIRRFERERLIRQLWIDGNLDAATLIATAPEESSE